jgi:adenine specific DNA methylase Mod
MFLLDFHENRGKNYLQNLSGKRDFREDQVSETDFIYGGDLYHYLTYFMGNLGKIMLLNIKEFHENRRG